MGRIQHPIYTIGENNEEAITELTSLSQKLFTWLSNNQIKANHGKCQSFTFEFI